MHKIASQCNDKDTQGESYVIYKCRYIIKNRYILGCFGHFPAETARPAVARYKANEFHYRTLWSPFTLLYVLLNFVTVLDTR